MVLRARRIARDRIGETWCAITILAITLIRPESYSSSGLVRDAVWCIDHDILNALKVLHKKKRALLTSCHNTIRCHKLFVHTDCPNHAERYAQAKSLQLHAYVIILRTRDRCSHSIDQSSYIQENSHEKTRPLCSQVSATLSLLSSRIHPYGCADYMLLI